MKLSLPLQIVVVLVGIAISTFAQQTGDPLIPPVQFVKVAPGDIKYDPWVAGINSSYKGELVYDDESVYRTETYDGQPLDDHILVRSIGDADGSQETLTPYLSKLVHRVGGSAYLPRFSPDGRFVVFKYGGIATDFPFEMYVLDIQSGVTKRVDNPKGQPYLPVFPEIRWSPDSNYLSWVENLGLIGNRLDLKQPGALRVCNWRTGESRIVARGDEVRYSFSWSAPHTLLWSLLPPQIKSVPSSSTKVKAPQHMRSVEDEPVTKEHPQLYQVDAAVATVVATAKPQKVLNDAFCAVVSPSGKRLAFFGSYDVSKPYPLLQDWDEIAGSAMYLSVADRDGSHRQPLSIQAGSYPQILWQHDDKHLISLEIEQTPAYDPEILNKPGSFNITLLQFDVTTSTRRIIASSLPGGDNDRLIGVSSDDSIVYLYVDEPFELVRNREFSAAYKIRDSIIAIDLQTGTRTLVAQTINAQGLDWHESP